MQTPTRLTTHEEYLGPPYFGRRAKFVNGRGIALNPPGPLRNEIAENLFLWLRPYFITTGLPYHCKGDLQVTGSDRVISPMLPALELTATEVLEV